MSYAPWVYYRVKGHRSVYGVLWVEEKRPVIASKLVWNIANSFDNTIKTLTYCRRGNVRYHRKREVHIVIWSIFQAPAMNTSISSTSWYILGSSSSRRKRVAVLCCHIS